MLFSYCKQMRNSAEQKDKSRTTILLDIQDKELVYAGDTTRAWFTR